MMLIQCCGGFLPDLNSAEPEPGITRGSGRLQSVGKVSGSLRETELELNCGETLLDARLEMLQGLGKTGTK